MNKEDNPTGVQFPADERGQRSSTQTARTVFARAAEKLGPKVTAEILAEPKWHKAYGSHLVELVRRSRSGPSYMRVASKGLEAVHDSFRFLRNGDEFSLQQAMEQFHQPAFHTGEIKGRNESPGELQVPLNGEILRGDTLKRQLDAWEKRGTMEPTAAAALHDLVDDPSPLDLRDLSFALLGAAAEVGPLEFLCHYGATVVAVDRPRSYIWQRLFAAARSGAGRMLFPVHKPLRGGEDEDELLALAGCDLLAEAPEIRTWLADLAMPYCIGGYAYLHGQRHVCVEVAMDMIMSDLAARRDDISLAFLLSPTDVFLVSEATMLCAQERFAKEGLSKLWRAPLRTISRQRLFAQNIEDSVENSSGVVYGLYDGIVPAQGPNYALAKRIQQWRAVSAKAAGVLVSCNVAPATATSSVMMRKDFSAALKGGEAYGMDVFKPETSNAVMGALLVHDLRNGSPDHTDDSTHPAELFMDNAVHGGLWRTGVQLRSVIEIAAARGFLKK